MLGASQRVLRHAAFHPHQENNGRKEHWPPRPSVEEEIKVAAAQRRTMDRSGRMHLPIPEGKDLPYCPYP
jgi:hypothetical protein